MRFPDFQENSINAQHEEADIEEGSQTNKADFDEPFVGQCFLSEEEALVFYQNFARKNGFSVRKGRFVNKKGERRRRDFFCHREGKPESKKDYSKIPRNRGYTRCECKAHMRITLRRINEIFPEEWQVTKFVAEHNHALLSTQEVRFLPSYRNIPLEDENRILLLNKVVWDGKMARCTCKNFEFVGILCRHVLSVLLHKGCFDIPPTYWLSRWSREKVQYNEIYELPQEENIGVSSSCANNSDLVTNAIELVQCPIVSKTKGRPKQKRMKSSKELGRQVRRCRLCKSSSHNFSTCPERHAFGDGNNPQQVSKKKKMDMQSEDSNPILLFKC
ncbi:hypothetical protein OROGR_010371 [Orobanche gracilis]